MKQTLECWSSTKKPPINDKKLRSRELWRSANKRLTPFATSQSSQKRLISRDLLLYVSSPLLYPCTYIFPFTLFAFCFQLCLFLFLFKCPSTCLCVLLLCVTIKFSPFLKYLIHFIAKTLFVFLFSIRSL